MRNLGDLASAPRASATEASTKPTRDPRAALAWLQSGKSVHIDALNLPDHLRHVRALAALEAQGGVQ